MAKISNISKVAAAAIIGSALFVGCGSSSTPYNPSSSVNGSVPKGYLDGATVWLDMNGDGVRDAAEITTTNSLGRYSISGTPTGTPVLVANGGIDTGSGDAFLGTLKAPFEKGATEVVISPLSTMVAAVVESGKSVDEAKKTVSIALGLSEDDLSVDPVAEAKKSDGNTSITKASLKVARLVEFIANKSGGTAANYGAIVASIAKDMSDNNSSIEVAASNASTSLTAADKSAVTALSTAIEAMTITKGATDAEVKAVETATKLAVKLLESNASKVINVDNLTSIATELITASDDNASATINLSIVTTLLGNVDLNATDFNISTATDLNLTSIIASATVDKDSYIKKQEAAAAEAAKKAAISIDKLKLKDNQVNIGDVTAKLSVNGTFASIAHATVEKDDISKLYDISFTLENILDYENNAYNSLEDGDEKNVSIALKIEDTKGVNKLLAVIDDLNLKREDTDDNNSNYNGNYVISITSGTKLSAWAIKSTGQQISAEGISLDTDSITSSNGKITANIGKIVDKLEANSQFASSIEAIKDKFTQDGVYTVSAYIDGVDGVVSSELSPASDIVKGFTIDNDDFSGSVSKISGTVSIGLSIADIKANNEKDVASAKTALTCESLTYEALSYDVYLPLSGSNGTTITWSVTGSGIDSTGKVTQTSSVQTATLTATITKGSGDTLATATKSFPVSIAATNVAPVLTAISDMSIDYNGSLDFSLSATDANTGDSLTYTMTGFDQAHIDSNENKIVGSEIIATGTHTISVTVTDAGGLSDTKEFSLTVGANPNDPFATATVLYDGNLSSTFDANSVKADALAGDITKVKMGLTSSYVVDATKAQSLVLTNGSNELVNISFKSASTHTVVISYNNGNTKTIELSGDQDAKTLDIN